MADGLSDKQIGARLFISERTATSAPATIAHQQVLEHGLSHLAWLLKDDEVVRRTLSDEWKAVLAPYEPEPFRHLG